ASRAYTPVPLEMTGFSLAVATDDLIGELVLDRLLAVEADLTQPLFDFGPEQALRPQVRDLDLQGWENVRGDRAVLPDHRVVIEPPVTRPGQFVHGVMPRSEIVIDEIQQGLLRHGSRGKAVVIREN